MKPASLLSIQCDTIQETGTRGGGVQQCRQQGDQDLLVQRCLGCRQRDSKKVVHIPQKWVTSRTHIVMQHLIFVCLCAAKASCISEFVLLEFRSFVASVLKILKAWHRETSEMEKLDLRRMDIVTRMETVTKEHTSETFCQIFAVNQMRESNQCCTKLKGNK